MYFQVQEFEESNTALRFTTAVLFFNKKKICIIGNTNLFISYSVCTQNIPIFHVFYFLASTSINNNERPNDLRNFGFNVQLL